MLKIWASYAKYLFTRNQARMCLTDMNLTRVFNALSWKNVICPSRYEQPCNEHHELKWILIATRL